MNDRQRVLNIDDVVVPEGRLRDVDDKRVAEIAFSMETVGGQITPIEVTPHADRGRWELISGAHRIAALKSIGATGVMAVVFEGDADTARMREIDENLIRHDLTPYDRAASLAERAAIWKRTHGETRGRPKKGDTLSPLSLYRDIEEQFGIPKHTAIRSIKLKEGIDPKAWGLLRGHAVCKSQTELDKLRRLQRDGGEPDADRQVAVAQKLKEGKFDSVTAALNSGRAAAERVDPVERIMRLIDVLNERDEIRLFERLRGFNAKMARGKKS